MIKEGAIVRDPRVFLFDEPLSNLDAALRVQTRLEIAKLHHDMTDVTMIYVTHDQVEAMTLADRICVLRDGKIEQVGTPSELYENPASLFVAGFIGSPQMNFLKGAFAEKHNCTTLGIRAEHIEIVDAADTEWTGKVVHAEDLGSDNYLFVDIGSPPPIIPRFISDIYLGIFFTDFVCDFLQLNNLFLTVKLLLAMIDAAKRAALIAPSSPIASVPTGIPFGI